MTPLIIIIISILAVGTAVTIIAHKKSIKEKAELERLERDRQYHIRQSQQNEEYRLNEERKKILRANIDIVIEKTSHDFYNVKLIRGDGEVSWLHYMKTAITSYDILVPRDLTDFQFMTWKSQNSDKKSGYVYNFPEELLPKVKQVIDHYLTYKTLEPVNIEVERLIVNREALPSAEDAKNVYKLLGYKGEPQQAQLQELIPALMKAVDDENVEEEISILEKLDEQRAINNQKIRSGWVMPK